MWIKSKFPKLPIIICGDALYLGKSFLELCNEYKFEYIIRYQETDAPTIKRNLDETKIKDDNYIYQNEIIFEDLKNKDFYTVKVISYNDKSINEETVGITITNFSFVTSLKINSKKKSDIVILGRNRWKIENKGFKEQKSDILNINHIYTKRCNGTKNLYLIIQFSHTLLNLLNYGDILIKNLITTKNEVSNLIKYALTSNNSKLSITKTTYDFYFIL